MTAVWVAVLVAVVVLAYYGMWRGWHMRAKRQSDIAEPQWIAPTLIPVGPTIAGTYVSTTSAGNWLDRINAHGLGSMRAVTLLSAADGFADTEDGLVVMREGAPTFRIPADALLGTRRERGIAGKVRNKDGLVVITWRLGSHELDTGIRPTHKADATRIERLVRELMEGANHG